jgi:hypothetical protein
MVVVEFEPKWLEGQTIKRYHGPYSTLGAAKGKRTTEINHGSYYAKDPNNVYILKSPAGEWEKVEL